MNTKEYWIWLSRLPHIGTKRFLALYNHFQEIEKVYFATKKELMYVPNLGEKAIESIINGKDLRETQEYIKMLKKQNVKFLLLYEEHYPTLLKNIYDPPPILYYKGKMLFNDLCISIVGSRKASYYGLKMAEKIAYELASLGVTIVSGMARGIDTYAHKGALQARGKTIAVLGCGVDVIYPLENRELMREIEKNGLVLSEYPLSTLPKANNFPARNRIISGLSLGTIVIEAGQKSGSLITANFALEQGREVYALPGNIDNQTSKGSNNLIKEGAKVVTNSEDIIEDVLPYINSKLNINHMERTSIQEELERKEGSIHLSKEEKIIFDKIKLGLTNKEDIIRESQYSASIVNSCLTMLELKGTITKHRDHYYIK